MKPIARQLGGRRALLSAVLPILVGASCSSREDVSTETTSQAFLSSRLYGTLCQQEYQNTWLGTNADTWTACANFNSAMSSLSPQAFYWNMQGAEGYFEEWGDTTANAGLDTVDVLYTSTHGGAWAGRAALSMWNQNVNAETNQMRLGDDSRGISLLAVHSCEILKLDDVMGRWTGVFDGGLRAVVGSHGSMFSGANMTDDGQKFANNLNAGQTVVNAWKNALIDSTVDNDVAVAFTGTDQTNCWNRYDTMNWSNLTTIARLQDAGWQYMCWNWWDDL